MDREWTDKRMDDFVKGVDHRFDEVGERFDRFEGSVDRRFDKVDRQFEKLDTKIDKMSRRLTTGLVTIVGAVIIKVFLG